MSYLITFNHLSHIIFDIAQVILKIRIINLENYH